MRTDKIFYLKLIVSIIFGVFLSVAYLYVNIKEDICLFNAYDILGYSCVGACFLFSLLFIKLEKKKILLTLALGINFVADYFLVLKPFYDNSQLIGISIFCLVHFFYFLYTISLYKKLWSKIVNITLHIILCLVAYFIINYYLVLSATEIIAVIYIVNSTITIFSLLIHIKKEWLLFTGLFLLFLCDIFVGIMWNGGEILGFNYSLIQFVNKYDLAFICYIPAEFLIALSAVWTGKNKQIT